VTGAVGLKRADGDPLRLRCEASRVPAGGKRPHHIARSRRRYTARSRQSDQACQVYPLFHVFGLARESAIVANVVNAELTKEF